MCEVSGGTQGRWKCGKAGVRYVTLNQWCGRQLLRFSVCMCEGGWRGAISSQPVNLSLDSFSPRLELSEEGGGKLSVHMITGLASTHTHTQNNKRHTHYAHKRVQSWHSWNGTLECFISLSSPLCPPSVRMCAKTESDNQEWRAGRMWAEREPERWF